MWHPLDLGLHINEVRGVGGASLPRPRAMSFLSSSLQQVTLGGPPQEEARAVALGGAEDLC